MKIKLSNLKARFMNKKVAKRCLIGLALIVSFGAGQTTGQEQASQSDLKQYNYCMDYYNNKEHCVADVWGYLAG